MRIYLAGGRDSDWRASIEAALPGVTCVDPFRDSAQLAIVDFVNEDLMHIETSDLVVAYCNHPSYGGMAAEMGFAYALKKPILYCHHGGRMDSFLAGLSKAVFTDLDSLVDYVKERYAVELA